MTKAEMEKQLEEQQKIIDKQKERVKTQNEKAKENWDTVSCRLPKGTKDRIKALGLSVNGFINKSVLAYLDCIEEEQEISTESAEQPKIETISAPMEEATQEQIEEPKKAYKEPTIDDLKKWQAELLEKKAEQDRLAEEKRKHKEELEEQSKKERKEELVEIVNKMRNGEPIPEDEEKEKLRQESIVKSNMDF